MRLALAQIFALAGMVVPACAFGQAFSDDPEIFVGRSYACAHSRSAETRRAAACESLERDKIALLRRYHDQPKILAMIAHPERVRRVGYVGVDRYPDPKTAPSHQ